MSYLNENYYMKLDRPIEADRIHRQAMCSAGCEHSWKLSTGENYNLSFH